MHLIDWLDPNQQLQSVLRQQTQRSPKQNLERLLQEQDILHLSVSDLAHLSGEACQVFTEILNSFTKPTPKKWLQQRRLEFAKTLLENASSNVTDVAFQIGYENVSNFIKAFKNRYGMTPNQFKNSP